MRSALRRLPPLLGVIVSATPLAAQRPIPVARGAAVERTLAAGAADTFALRVDAPSFVLGHAEQRTVDVAGTDSTGRVERDATSGRVTAILVSSGRVRDVRFVRQESVDR